MRDDPLEEASGPVKRDFFEVWLRVARQELADAVARQKGEPAPEPLPDPDDDPDF
jgi:hypothetical protein